jgi:hypothetical protein
MARDAMRRLLAALLWLPAAASANNGLLFIGFGSESLGMGGADTAVARDTTALNTNPAGLAQLGGGALDAYGGMSYAVDVGHRDALGNDVRVAERLTPSFGGGYARRVEGTALVWGFGLFVQGGAGNRFEAVRTASGTSDELSAQLVIAKLGPGAAYDFGGGLRAGVSVSLVAATLEQKLFPGTSLLAPAPFFGLDLQDLTATGVNARFGVQYQAGAGTTLAMVYSPKTRLDFEDGTLRSNQSAAGLGTVTYRDARVDGFALPQELSAGVATGQAPAFGEARVAELGRCARSADDSRLEPRRTCGAARAAARLAARLEGPVRARARLRLQHRLAGHRVRRAQHRQQPRAAGNPHAPALAGDRAPPCERRALGSAGRRLENLRRRALRAAGEGDLCEPGAAALPGRAERGAHRVPERQRDDRPLLVALFFHSSHGRSRVPRLAACERRPSSSLRNSMGPSSCEAWSCRRAFISV